MEEGSYNVSNHFTISLILLVLLLVSLIRNSAVLCGKKSLCVAVSFLSNTQATQQLVLLKVGFQVFLGAQES